MSGADQTAAKAPSSELLVSTACTGVPVPLQTPLPSPGTEMHALHPSGSLFSAPSSAWREKALVMKSGHTSSTCFHGELCVFKKSERADLEKLSVNSLYFPFSKRQGAKVMFEVWHL